MTLPTIEDMEGVLDTSCMAILGDTISYKPAGGSFAATKAYVDHREALRALDNATVIEQAITVQLLMADHPVKPGGGARVTLPKIAGAIFHPVNVRFDASGTHWEFELERVSA